MGSEVVVTLLWHQQTSCVVYENIINKIRIEYNLYTYFHVIFLFFICFIFHLEFSVPKSYIKEKIWKYIKDDVKHNDMLLLIYLFFMTVVERYIYFLINNKFYGLMTIFLFLCSYFLIYIFYAFHRYNLMKLKANWWVGQK